MANGYLYLRCHDCDEMVPQRNDHYTLFRDFENLTGHGRWSKEGLEAWLKAHIEGECRGAIEKTGYEYTVRPERVYLTTELTKGAG